MIGGPADPTHVTGAVSPAHGHVILNFDRNVGGLNGFVRFHPQTLFHFAITLNSETGR